MTRKDYEYIADYMARTRTTTATDTWVQLLHILIKICQDDNPRFSEDRFREACYR
jgi:hypothetical protein